MMRVIAMAIAVILIVGTAQAQFGGFGKMGNKGRGGNASGGGAAGCAGAIDLRKTCVIPAFRGIP